MQENTIRIILAGGIGSRLHPLTAERAKPAVPFGGRYRIIDFTLSNCLHSGLRRVLVLTQYKSQSLQKHLRDGWSIFNPECGEYITPVPPQMRTGASWYSGTADAIYQNLYLLERIGAELGAGSRRTATGATWGRSTRITRRTWTCSSRGRRSTCTRTTGASAPTTARTHRPAWSPARAGPRACWPTRSSAAARSSPAAG